MIRLFLKRFLFFLPGSFLIAFSRIEIEKEDDSKLVLNSDGFLFVFDKRCRIVTCHEKLLSIFNLIETVDIEHYINGRRFEWWVLSLKLKCKKKILIGRSLDGTAVSIAASHAATIMNKSVRSVERVGL